MGHHDSETILAEDNIHAFRVWTYEWWGSYWVKMTEGQYGYADGGDHSVEQQHVDREYDNIEEAMRMHLLCIRNVIHRTYPGAIPEFETVQDGNTIRVQRSD